MIVGACWNLLVRNVYAELMAARIFQGVGWGVVEGVLAESVSGLFAVRIPPNPYFTFIIKQHSS